MCRKLVIGALVSMFAATFVVPALGQEPTVIEVYEDFAGDTAGPGWQQGWTDGVGSWTIDGETLSGDGHAWYDFVSHGWSDLVAEFSVSLRGHLHLNANVSDPGFRYVFSIRRDESDGPAVIQILRGDPGEDLQPLTDPETLELDSDLLISISVAGSNLSMRVNGAELSAVDPDPLAAGNLGIEFIGGGTSWVQIYDIALRGTLPTTSPATTAPPPQTEGPDAAIGDLTATALDEARIEYRVVLRNYGDEWADPGLLFFAFDGVYLDETEVSRDLAPNESWTETRVLTVPEGLRGQLSSASVWIEPPEDADQSNNAFARNVSLTPAPSPPVTPGPTATFPSSQGGSGSENPPDPGPDWWIVLIAVGGAAGAAGGVEGGRRLRRRRAQDRALDEPLDGRCRPGRDRYIQREFNPDANLRKVTSLTFAAQDAAGEEVKHTKALRGKRTVKLLNRSLNADRLGAHERTDREVNKACEQLATDIDVWRTKHAFEGILQIAVGYEGGKAPATFSNWVCTAAGDWPDPETDKPKHRWKASVEDSGEAELGDLRIGPSRSHADLVRDLVRMTSALMGSLSERDFFHTVNLKAKAKLDL
ncbi:MAG: hypothetical protein KJO44_04335 [Gemmatimonadetes bacterium]|nr:hypothetical protein [Gemmatimonadota bacterium]